MDANAMLKNSARTICDIICTKAVNQEFAIARRLIDITMVNKNH